jgi:hypothetical protein
MHIARNENVCSATGEKIAAQPKRLWKRPHVIESELVEDTSAVAGFGPDFGPPGLSANS